MPDIKRNKTTSIAEQEPQPANDSSVERRPLPGSFVKQERLQVHFGNVEGLKLKLLENISNGIQTLCDLLDETGEKRKAIAKKREEQANG